MKNVFFWLLFFCFSTNVLAENVSDETIQETDTLKLDSLMSVIQKSYEIEKNLTYERGIIELNNGLATLKVPKGFKFLNAEQSRLVLSDLWGNPPDENTLGMIFPEHITPLGDSFTYAVEITYSEEGYIEDDDAKDLDYDDLLKQMKEDAIEGNEARKEAGYSTIDLVGWATPPYYDAATKKLYWAKELNFEGSEVNTLNYNIRVLGRKGVLVLNVISNMDKLTDVQANVETIISSVDFNEGHRYSDFNPSVDKVAAYGVGGLIAGKVLAKTGFLALAGKFGKFIIFGLIAAAAGIKKFFFGKKEE